MGGQGREGSENGSEKLGDGLSSEDKRTVATVVPQGGHERALRGRPVKAATGPWQPGC